MATSPLFGWEEPDDTDLVKDGAAAIRTLGNAIDTSMGDLLGGTTGQVLSKASNTNMDFTWVTSDDANAIQNTIVDAKGDLISATGSDVPARLAVGANGETLVADSSTSTGLRYTAGNPISNPILNSAFQIWQRGTSFTGLTASQATADRWFVNPGVSGGSGAVTRQTTSDTTNLPNIQYCARVQRTASNTSTNAIYLANSFETMDSIPYAGKTVTLSFYARKGANFSGTGLAAAIYTGTGTDQNLIMTGYTGAAASVVDNVTLTTTWQRFTITGAIPAATTEIAPTLYYTPVGTAGAADYFEVTGVQIDVGSVALPFRTYAATIQGELAACQRYYYRFASGVNGFLGLGTYYTASSVYLVVYFPVAMRIAPTLDATSGTNFYGISSNNGFDSFNSFTLFRPSTTGAFIFNSSEASGTSGSAGMAESNNASAFVAFTAEL